MLFLSMEVNLVLRVAVGAALYASSWGVDLAKMIAAVGCGFAAAAQQGLYDRIKKAGN